MADSHWPSTFEEQAKEILVLNRPPASELNMENGMLKEALISQSSMELTTCPSKSVGINSDVSTSVGWLSSVRHFKQTEYVAESSLPNAVLVMMRPSNTEYIHFCLARYSTRIAKRC